MKTQCLHVLRRAATTSSPTAIQTSSDFKRLWDYDVCSGGIQGPSAQ